MRNAQRLRVTPQHRLDKRCGNAFDHTKEQPFIHMSGNLEMMVGLKETSSSVTTLRTLGTEIGTYLIGHINQKNVDCPTDDLGSCRRFAMCI